MRNSDENKVTGKNNKNKKIHLIRHGHTEANEKRLYCGKTDLPLSQSGADKIKSLKNDGIYPEADIYYSSGLMRTNQTLTIIYGDCDVNFEPCISEYNFGEFEMKSYDMLKEDERYIEWIEDTGGYVKCPDGESKRQFNSRVIKGFERIMHEILCMHDVHSASAAAVCHGGTIANIMEYLFPSMKNFYEWQPETGRGYTITCGVNSDGERCFTYKSI